MYFKQFYLGCLAHASYIVGSDGEAAVIDPQRDVDQYVEEAKKEGLSIKYIIETHLHADFVSGHRELEKRTGAQIVFGEKAGATFPHLAVKDGDVLEVGSVRLHILETPGHTPESICVLAKDLTSRENSDKLFTGDTLFIGDVGRPDLVGSKGYTAKDMAGMMFDSLHGKLLKLSDATEVYPAHGAGSLCGKQLSNERSSTIGQQKQFNYALKAMSKEVFVDMLTADQPEVPQYFPKDAEINRTGARELANVGKPQALSGAEVNKRMKEGAALLDVRSGTEFASGHIKGSLNIGLGGQFASWAGTLLKLDSPIVVVASDQGSVDDAVMRLARVGIESVIGYLENGIIGWSDAGLDVVQTPVITVDELKREIESAEDIIVIDVRRSSEYESGHVPTAINIPLAELAERVGELPKEWPLALICASGYRSSIAKSLLESAGINSLSLINVLGGTTAWKAAGFGVEKQEKAAV